MKLILVTMTAFFLSSCSPKIYVVDRQTVMEQESAGDWPQFDKKVTDRSAASGQTPFGQVPLTAKKAQLYKVLNGELDNQLAAQVGK